MLRPALPLPRKAWTLRTLCTYVAGRLMPLACLSTSLSFSDRSALGCATSPGCRSEVEAGHESSRASSSQRSTAFNSREARIVSSTETSRASRRSTAVRRPFESLPSPSSRKFGNRTVRLLRSHLRQRPTPGRSSAPCVCDTPRHTGPAACPSMIRHNRRVVLDHTKTIHRVFLRDAMKLEEAGQHGPADRRILNECAHQPGGPER